MFIGPEIKGQSSKPLLKFEISDTDFVLPLSHRLSPTLPTLLYIFIILIAIKYPTFFNTLLPFPIQFNHFFFNINIQFLITGTQISVDVKNRFIYYIFITNFQTYFLNISYSKLIQKIMCLSMGRWLFKKRQRHLSFFKKKFLMSCINDTDWSSNTKKNKL